MNLPGARPDDFAITPEQAHIHQTARPIVRALIEARCGGDSELLAMLEVGA